MKLSEQYDEIIGWNEDDGTAHIRNDVIKLEAENAALKQALTLISDIGYDYDGYGTPHDLKKLIDEMVGYARNPRSAVDALTAEEPE